MLLNINAQHAEFLVHFLWNVATGRSCSAESAFSYEWTLSTYLTLKDLLRYYLGSSLENNSSRGEKSHPVREHARLGAVRLKKHQFLEKSVYFHF